MSVLLWELEVDADRHTLDSIVVETIGRHVDIVDAGRLTLMIVGDWDTVSPVLLVLAARGITAQLGF